MGYIYIYILGLYRDHGKENGNYCNGVYRVLGLGMLGGSWRLSK